MSVQEIFSGVIIISYGVVCLIDFIRFKGKSKHSGYSLMNEMYGLFLAGIFSSSFNTGDTTSSAMIVLTVAVFVAFMAKRVFYGVDIIVNASNKSQVDMVIRKLLKKDNYNAMFESKKMGYKLFVKEPRAGLARFSIRVSTGFNLILTHKIIKAMSKDLEKIDGRKSMAYGYLLGFVLMTVLGLFQFTA